ncbi:MAG: hypothetical protein H6625_08345 [Bdellovibrionaceae bacterium]|nr:hypothetical protein [Pseudobdellovibrionaceae bacterium]
MKLLKLLVFFILLQAPFWMAYAQETGAKAEVEIKSSSLIERSHKSLSDGIVSLSQQLDSIWGSDLFEDEKPDSSLKLRFSSVLAEREAVQYKMQIKSRLVLPRTQKRFNLVLQNLKDTLTEDSVNTAGEEFENAELEADKTVKESDFSAALRYVFKQKAGEHIHTDAGVKFKIPLDPFVKLRARQSIPLGLWEWSFQEGGEWFKSSGTAYDAGFNFVRRLNLDFWFHQTNVARWTEESSQYDFQNGISIVQILASSRSLTYYLSASGGSEPTVAIQSYTLGTTLRTWVFWQWLNFELNPFGSWARTRNFSFQPGVAARLEAIIGSF